MIATDETHDPALRSFISSANAPDCDFPIQNLPYCAFRPRRLANHVRIGVAIGDAILDIGNAAHLLDGPAVQAATACRERHLNTLMKQGPAAWAALRQGISRLLRADSRERSRVDEHLAPIAAAEFFVPVQIGNFTDFFASIFHATNAGRLLRPDDPLTPNYKYLPLAYHARPSSVCVSGMPVRRPCGQTRRSAETAPVYRASRSLDYELELGF